MTQPKEKGGVPPIEIYTIPGVDEIHDAKNEDDEFKRIQNENEWREKQLLKVRNLQDWTNY